RSGAGKGMFSGNRCSLSRERKSRQGYGFGSSQYPHRQRIWHRRVSLYRSANSRRKGDRTFRSNSIPSPRFVAHTSRSVVEIGLSAQAIIRRLPQTGRSDNSPEMKSAPEEPDYASQPHDAFFKDIFSEPEHATGFFKKHLPAVIAEKIDWLTLTVMPGSFVKTELQQ